MVQKGEVWGECVRVTGPSEGVRDSNHPVSEQKKAFAHEKGETDECCF